MIRSIKNNAEDASGVYANPMTLLQYSENRRKWNTISDNRMCSELIMVLQDELHNLLSSFMDGRSMSRPSQLLYPIIDISHIFLGRKLKEMHALICNLSSYGLNFDESLSMLDKSKGRHCISSNRLASIICALYRDLHRNLQDINMERKVARIEVEVFDEAEYVMKDKEYLKPVVLLKAYLQSHLGDYLQGLYVHGSISTMDYVMGFSDLDTLVILDEKCFKEPSALLFVRKHVYKSTAFMYMIDPLQHHGHFLLTPMDINFYPQSYFPLILLEYSKCLLGRTSFAFYERNSDLERSKMFLDFYWSLRIAYQRGARFRELYWLKSYLSFVMLLPCIYFQARGQYCYKKFSFDMLKEEFGGQAKVVGEISKIRQNWTHIKRYPTGFGASLAKFPNPFMFALSSRLLNLRIPKSLEEDIKTIPKDAFHLSEFMLAKLQQEDRI